MGETLPERQEFVVGLPGQEARDFLQRRTRPLHRCAPVAEVALCAAKVQHDFRDFRIERGPVT